MFDSSYFNKAQLRTQQTKLGGARYLSDDDAKQALKLKRSGVKLLYIASRFNVTVATIRRYIKHAEELEDATS